MALIYSFFSLESQQKNGLFDNLFFRKRQESVVSKSVVIVKKFWYR